jgi:hypothetical protein
LFQDEELSKDAENYSRALAEGREQCDENKSKALLKGVATRLAQTTGRLPLGFWVNALVSRANGCRSKQDTCRVAG